VVSTPAEQSLFDAIADALGPWRAIWRGPLPSARPQQTVRRSRFVTGADYADHLERVSSGPVHRDRAIVAPDTERFFVSHLYRAFLAGELVVEVAQPGPAGWSEAITKSLPRAFWQEAQFAIVRDPPKLSEFVGGRWRRLGNPVIRPNEGNVKTEPATKAEAEYGGLTKLLKAGLRANRPQLEAMRTQGKRAEFLAKNVKCSLSHAKQFLQREWRQT
jgi:hypothetical protein